MKTLGIDIASQARDTALAAIEWPETGSPRLIAFSELEESQFTDDRLTEVLRSHDWGRVAIDVPFGWPSGLLDLLGRWRRGEVVDFPAERRKGRSETLYRRTDLVTWDRTGVKPIPVGVENLAWVSLRAFHVLSQADLHRDRVGLRSPVLETYPKAALKCWPEMPLESTKSGDSAPRARAEALARLVETVALRIDDVDRGKLVEETKDHRFDALVCALVARAAMVGRTQLPVKADADAADQEGWIHLPSEGSLTTLARPRYLAVEMPDSFVLETLDGGGDWLEWGRYRREQFDRLPDGSYVCGGHGGSPMWIRCVRREHDRLHVIDGGGRPFIYSLRSIEQSKG